LTAYVSIVAGLVPATMLFCGRFRSRCGASLHPAFLHIAPEAIACMLRWAGNDIAWKWINARNAVQNARRISAQGRRKSTYEVNDENGHESDPGRNERRFPGVSCDGSELEPDRSGAAGYFNGQCLLGHGA
jgi:hypothetical protein